MKFISTTLRRIFCHLQGHPGADLQYEPHRLTWHCVDCNVTGRGWLIADRRKEAR